MINGFDQKKIDGAASVLRALRNELREKMLHVIEDNEGICVSDLYRKMGIEQSVASQHLSILRNAGIVKTQREGKNIHYYLDRENNGKISELANSLAQFTNQ